MLGFACGQFACFKLFWPLALAQRALAAIIFHALRRLGGVVLFRSSRPSPSWGFPFWPSGLTVRRSRPPTAAAELRALVPRRNRNIEAHAFSTGIQFLRRYSAPGLPCLRASPAGRLLVSSLFGLWRFHSKRDQLSFFMRCVASVAQCFFAVRARRQVGATRFGHRV